jgi:hypothetical protein
MMPAIQVYVIAVAALLAARTAAHLRVRRRRPHGDELPAWFATTAWVSPALPRTQRRLRLAKLAAFLRGKLAIEGPASLDNAAVLNLRVGLHAKRWFDVVGHFSREDVLLGLTGRRGIRPSLT